MKRKARNDADYQRLLAQERLILEATETIIELLGEQRVSRRELADRLGKSKGFVSHLLSGERNMTLRTLADLGHALGQRFSIVPRPETVPQASGAGSFGALFRAYAPLDDPRRGRLSPETVNEFTRSAKRFSVDLTRYDLSSVA